DGKPIICCECEGPLRGGFCLFCDSKAENSFTYDPNEYSFNDTSSNFNHLPQPQYETYLCELCGNNSHYGYDCQPQFSLVYEQEPSYDQNYNDNYYLHNSASFLCCDNCGGSHETFQCQPIDQNIDSSGFDQIQTPQYPVIDHPSQEMSEENFQAKGNLMKFIQTFLEKFNHIPFGEMPKIILQVWEKFFVIQHAQPEDTNELFQKLLEDLQIINEELAEYINSLSWSCPTFFNDNEEHSRRMWHKSLWEQKKNMEDTLLELLEVCRQKEFYCMHNDVDDLIESALNSKLLSINLRSQCLDKKKQEVKNIVKQPTKHGTRIAKSLQNFRVKKRSTSLNNTSQISPVHAITPVLPTEETEYSLSMGYEHPSTIPKTESDEVIKSSAKNLLPIPSEYEVTSDDESECDVPVKDESSSVFTTFSNTIFDCIDDFTSSDDESLSNEVVPMEDFKVYLTFLFDDEEINSDKIDHIVSMLNLILLNLCIIMILCLNLLRSLIILRSFLVNLCLPALLMKGVLGEHEEYISLMEKLFTINSFPRPLENFHANSIIETLPTSLILVEDSDSLREEIDIFTGTDALLPPGIESGDYDSERDIHFLEELLVNDSIPENKSSNFDHHDDPSFPSMMNNIDELNEDECFDPGGEIDVFTNVEDDDYFSFIFVIRIFLPYLIYPEVSPLLLSARNEDTIFDPSISI
nr:hypothetical protein [Tanacetum cinerariifolium]